MEAIIYNNNISYVDSRIILVLVLLIFFYYLKCGSPIKEFWDDDYDDDDEYEGTGAVQRMLAKDPSDKDEEGYGYSEPHSHTSMDAQEYLKAQAAINAANPPTDDEKSYIKALEKLKKAQDKAVTELSKHTLLTTKETHPDKIPTSETFQSLEGIEDGGDDIYDRKLMGL